MRWLYTVCKHCLMSLNVLMVVPYVMPRSQLNVHHLCGWSTADFAQNPCVGRRGLHVFSRPQEHASGRRRFLDMSNILCGWLRFLMNAGGTCSHCKEVHGAARQSCGGCKVWHCHQMQIYSAVAARSPHNQRAFTVQSLQGCRTPYDKLALAARDKCVHLAARACLPRRI